MAPIVAEAANTALVTVRLPINAQVAAAAEMMTNSQPHHLLLQKLLAQKQFFTANFEGAGESTTEQTNAATVRDATSQQRHCLRSCCTNYCWKVPDASKPPRTGTRPGRFRARCHLQRPPTRCDACLHYSGGYYSRGETSPAASAIDAVVNFTTIGHSAITLKNGLAAHLQPRFDCYFIGP